MHWIQPAYLWLAAALLPAILLLYLLKRKYQDQTISSTLLWEHVLERMEANRPWEKLWRHLLLWLQLLAAILFVLGLSRPAIATEGLKADHTIFLIDVSGSMQAVEGEMTRLEKAKQKAHQMIDRMNRDQTVTLVEVGRTPRVVLSQSNDFAALHQAVDQLEGQVGSSDIQSALTLAHALISKQPSSEIILLGDGANQSGDLNLFPHRFLQMGTAAENVSIGSLSTSGKGTGSGLFARLDHFGNRDAQVTVTVSNDTGQILDTRTVRLKKNESTSISWDKLPLAGFYHVKIASSGDHLPLDNEQWAIPQQTDKTRILLTGKENLFLSKALQLVKTAEIVQADRTRATGGGFPVIVINEGKGGLPEKGHLLLFNPDSSVPDIPVTGTTAVTGNVTKDERHPIMNQVPLQQIHIADVKKVKVPAWADVILHAGDTPLILAGEHQGRRVVVFTFDLQKSDLPLQPGFPVLMVQAFNWLAPAPGISGTQAEAGESVKLSLPPAIQQVQIQTPDADKETKPLRGGVLTYTVPERSGLYRVTDDQKNKLIHYLTVPFPNEESKIGPQKVPTVSLREENTPAAGEQELWWWVALFSMAAVGLEWVVFSRGY
ncbi:VWA domain-containing protein [Paenactinomyces guangxiensis]|uniref:VWA domain-containing protein n=1 Tax=Paenactinomyces guangxiensis TaxID=1490290 RepID=A0A7W1WPF9_9BACL|nr:VWA domain-containing protein [Paenactinomyces guangxiensis]MBA4493641.1 VWA domain-containing protein [Paenactinomyces guangxiensis]MBH8590928.1 VWA domain-containing protein [Paenactinomyces guangxiensis]